MGIHNTDILVVGAGPAGCCAAQVAADAGLSVIAIDKRRVIGVPIQCAEYIPAPLGGHALSPGVKVQSIDEMLSTYNSSESASYSCRGIMINRSRFDQALAVRAQSAGAVLWRHCYLQALDNQVRQARVTGKKGAHTIHYKLLIAADGPRSRIAGLLGMQALATINTRQYRVALQTRLHASKVWLSSRYPGGYAWLFPIGRFANLGVGFESTSSAHLKKQLDIFHQGLQIEGIVSQKVYSRTGGPIPVAGLRKPLYTSNTLFVGDAAGLTHPISGAGIAAAVSSGELAGQAAVEFLLSGNSSALLDYSQDIHDLYAASLQHALQKRRELEQYWRLNHPMPSELLKRFWITDPSYRLS
ncbi:MAG: geranylgeranyl reductase family protein [Thiohalomonadales bacterium]